MRSILPGHGSGGRLMDELINNTIRSRLGSAVQLDDSAVIEIGNSKIAFTTDSYTITPVFFSGGNIGSLAVNGTVNDLAVMGAKPMYLSCGLILEEGFDIGSLEKILDSMKASADAAGVKIVTGDTKVVPHGKADAIFINTAGIGIIKGNVERRRVVPGDRIITSGTLGDHGMTIMAGRHGLSFASRLESDCAPLAGFISAVRDKFPDAIKFMRDPTRGGLASVMNEIVKSKEYGIRLDETMIPVRNEVRGVARMLGLDPLYAANEGKCVIVCDKHSARDMVSFMRQLKEGTDAADIGEVDASYPGKVYLVTTVGGRRILPLLSEEQLPRIC